MSRQSGCGQGGQHLVHATLFCLGRVYKVNNTFFRFCGCLFHILLVRASPFAGACFVFAGALFHILLVRASLFCWRLFRLCWCPVSHFAGVSLSFCWYVFRLLPASNHHISEISRPGFFDFVQCVFLSYADKVVYKVRGAESAFCHHMAVGSER